MTNLQVIQAFINGETKGESSNGNLWISDNQLINYNTSIAKRVTDKYFTVNTTKYSNSTSKIQNLLLRQLGDLDLEYDTFTGKGRGFRFTTGL